MESEKQVIAVKQKGMLRGVIIVLVWGVVLTVLGVVMLIFVEDGKLEGGVGFSCGIISLLFGIAGLCSVCTTPAEIIIYEDGLLRFADGTTCEPWEIENMIALPDRRRLYDLSWGSLIVTVRGENKTYENIADVREVYKKLRTLIKKSLKSGGRSAAAEQIEGSVEEEETDGEFDG